MKINYCLPIIKNKKEDVLKIIEENTYNYDFFEIWLDYIDNLDSDFILLLKKMLDNRLILLFRRVGLEKIKMSISDRFDIIKSLNNTANILDLDIRQVNELDYIINTGLNINTVISYHNYTETPPDDKINKIIKEIMNYNPKILKISTMCKSGNDALRLLDQLLRLKESRIKCIVLGMGKLGRITRIFGTLWGNELVFAPVLETELSKYKGQYTKKQLDIIFKSLSE